MSVLLRAAVRQLLEDVGLVHAIHERSRLGALRRIMHADAQRDTEEPSGCHPQALRLAALVGALRHFRQAGGGHFVGCPANRTLGPCSTACCVAQLALSPETADQADGTVQVLHATIVALERERRTLVRTVRRLQGRPGRPRKTPRSPDPARPPIDPHSTAGGCGRSPASTGRRRAPTRASASVPEGVTAC